MRGSLRSSVIGLCTLGIAAATLTAGPVALPAAVAAAQHAAFGTVAVANFDGASVTEYPPNSTGNVTPIADITGAATGLDGPTGLAFDEQGRLYVANFNANSITVYAPGADGNTAPVRTIVGATNTMLDQPIGLAVNRHHDVWVANLSGSILEFGSGALGDVAPIRAITGPHTGITELVGLALTSDDKGVWVTDEASAGPPPVEREFAATANGDAAPIRQLSGNRTQLALPYGVAGARDGSLVFSDVGDGSGPLLLTFGKHAHGNATPRTVVSGSSTGLNAPQLIGLDAVAQPWVPEFDAPSVTRYARDANGNAAPNRTIVGAATGLSEPEGAAVFVVPPSAPRHVRTQLRGRTLRLRWRAPRVNGGGIEGYFVQRARNRGGPWHTVKTTTRHHAVKRHAKPGFYRVVAFNERGTSPGSNRVRVH